ncbi:hypothetical protein C8Q70DRAFT_238333 [Cubamyces menziesii]|nr:hypothetical protein C8Q70DRAFT_238333 [Cubamyces menziesii]
MAGSGDGYLRLLSESVTMTENRRGSLLILGPLSRDPTESFQPPVRSRSAEVLSTSTSYTSRCRASCRCAFAEAPAFSQVHPIVWSTDAPRHVGALMFATRISSFHRAPEVL